MRICALLLPFAIAACPAAAEERFVGRYSFVPVEAGALRLDTATGEVSLCSVEGGTTTCKAVGGRPAGGPAEAADLEARIARLESRIAALEAGSLAVPDDESIDRVMVLADRMMRRFFGLVRDFKRDMDSEAL
jgi:hypothetical protein